MTRTVLVTGGTRGIGAAVVRALLARGCHVGCGYFKSKGQAGRMAAEFGSALLPVHYSLGDANSARSAVDAMVTRFGRLDGLVANAGVWRGGLLDTLEESVWDGVLDENVKGVSQICRAALPALATGEAASITIMSSVVGLIGNAGDTAYASAKAALVGFGRSLAKETANRGIRVNVLAPGFVETEMTLHVSLSSRERIQRAIVLGRFGTCEEIARAAVFLSEDASYCTGTVLCVDGGWSL